MTTANSPRSVYRLAILGILLLAAPLRATNGYLIHGVGTCAKGLAGAGVALPQDALSPAVNPAGLAFLGERYDVGLAFFSPRREYTVSGDPSQFPGTFGLAPGTVESESEVFFVPDFGANWEIGANSHFGLSIYGQGGMNTDYPVATFYGSSPTGVDLSQMFIVPSYAYEVAPGHALGINAIVAAQAFEAQGLEAFGGFSQDPLALSNNGHDQSFGFGARVGYLGQWSERFSFGASFQSEVRMQEFDDYAGLFAEGGGFDIPANWSVGFAIGLSDRLTLAADVQEVYYSDVKSVGLPFANLFAAPLGADNGAGFGWEDMTIFKAGLLCELDEQWTLRFGVSVGDQPIPESEILFNILAPGVMEEHFTAGFTRVLPSGRAFHMALLYAPSVNVAGPNPLEVPGLQTIELEMRQYELEIGYSWGF